MGTAVIENLALLEPSGTPRSDVVSARELMRPAAESSLPPWGLEALAGRFVELTGASNTASLSAAAMLVLEAQRRGVLTAWIAGPRSSFFPPDLAQRGIDLAALPVVRVPDIRRAARVANVLLHSGSFGLILLDVNTKTELSLTVQSRLVSLAKQHRTALVCLSRQTQHHTPRLPLVSLRNEAGKSRCDHDAFKVTLHAARDKRRAPGWAHRETCCGPGGLC